jgi:glycosyltransferase involved in cell wall biosynthesis
VREPEFQLSILCLGDDYFSERLDPGQRVSVIKWKKLPGSLWNWVQMFRALQPDVIVFIYGWMWAFPRKVSLGAWLARIPRRFSIQQLVISRQGVSPKELSEQTEQDRSIRGALQRLLHPIALRISAYFFRTTICVSHAMKKSLVTDFGFPAKKIRMIHNAVSVSDFVPSEINGAKMRAQLGILPDEFVLICAARLSEQKGIDILLRAVARVLRDGVQCKLIIVGDGPLRDQLRKQAQELDLSGAVSFEGFQSDIRPYLQAGSAFVLTSHMEGLPLSIVEAMACGLPCIVTDVGGNAEAVIHRIHGMVVPPGSAEATADAISYVVTHPQECARMSRMARERACEAFDIENRMAEIKRVILN